MGWSGWRELVVSSFFSSKVDKSSPSIKYLDNFHSSEQVLPAFSELGDSFRLSTEVPRTGVANLRKSALSVWT